MIAAYIRVSTEGQQEAYGPDLQAAAIEQFAKAKGLVIDRWFEDAITGATDNRPNLNEIRELGKQGVLKRLIIYKLDRFSRDVIQGEMIWRELSGNGVRIESVSEYMDDSPMGVLIRQIFFAFAQYERVVIKERTSKGKAASARKGTYLGGRGVYGYRPIGDGKLEIVPEEAEIIRQIFRYKKEQPRASLRIIAEQFDLKYTHVKKILDRHQFYRGKALLHPSAGQASNIIHEPILTNR